MKIAIIGYSGAGKSTLAQALGQLYGLEVLHLDAVHHLPGWVERDLESEQEIVTAFLDSHDSWVIDGNYSKVCFQRRMEEADLIIMLLFNRLSSLIRITKRYHVYKGQNRPDMGPGCYEKLDREFIRWVLWKGRGRDKRARYRRRQEQYPDKTVVLKTQRQIDAFLASLGENEKGPSAKP